MSKALGFKFVLVNDVQQMLDPKVFCGGKFLHLATVKRGVKEYIIFRELTTNKTYLEILNPKSPELFERITDDQEWSGLYHWAKAAGLLEMGVNKEYKQDASKPHLISSRN